MPRKTRSEIKDGRRKNKGASGQPQDDSPETQPALGAPAPYRGYMVERDPAPAPSTPVAEQSLPVPTPAPDAPRAITPALLASQAVRRTRPRPSPGQLPPTGSPARQQTPAAKIRREFATSLGRPAPDLERVALSCASLLQAEGYSPVLIDPIAVRYFKDRHSRFRSVRVAFGVDKSMPNEAIIKAILADPGVPASLKQPALKQILLDGARCVFGRPIHSPQGPYADRLIMGVNLPDADGRLMAERTFLRARTLGGSATNLPNPPTHEGLFTPFLYIPGHFPLDSEVPQRLEAPLSLLVPAATELGRLALMQPSPDAK